MLMADLEDPKAGAQEVLHAEGMKAGMAVGQATVALAVGLLTSDLCRPNEAREFCILI